MGLTLEKHRCYAVEAVKDNETISEATGVDG